MKKLQITNNIFLEIQTCYIRKQYLIDIDFLLLFWYTYAKYNIEY